MKDHPTDRLLADVDDSFIEEAMPGRLREATRPRARITRWLAAAACLVVVAGIGTAAAIGSLNTPLPDVSDRLETKIVAKNDPASDINVDNIGGSISIASRLSFSYHGRTYIGNGTTVTRHTAETLLDSLDPAAEDATPSPDMYYPGGIVEVYKLRGISADCAVAIGTQNGGALSVCINPGYRPDSLGTLMTDLYDAAVFTTVRYSFTDKSGQARVAEFDCPAEKLRALLVSSPGTAKSGEPQDDFDACLTICMDIPSLGYTDVPVRIAPDGRVRADVLGSTCEFRIKKSSVRSFVSYLAQSCDGYLLVFEQ